MLRLVLIIPVFVTTLALLMAASIALGNQRDYPPLVYVVRADPHDEIRMLDLNTGFWIEVARNESFGVIDVSSAGDILVTTHAPVGSILNTVTPALIDVAHGIDDNPTWSPAADRIAYRRYYYQGGLYVYTRGQWPPRPLRIRATAITWSPDGHLLAYSRWNDTSDQEEIRMVDVRTRADAGLIAGWRKPVRYMRWSPDGKHIALTTIAGEFYLLDVQDKTFTQLLVDTQHVRSAQWSADGALLGVISTSRGQSMLTVLDETHQIRDQFPLDALSRTSSFDWWSTQ